MEIDMSRVDAYLQIAEAAEMLGVCQNTLRNWGLAGKAIPVISITQRAGIPDSWLRNKHRGNLSGISLPEASK